MSEYINKRRALDAVCEICPFDCTNKERADIPCASVTVLMSIRPADVEPVKHGHWIEDQDRIVCSECGTRFKDEIIYMQENKPGAPHRCLECGAIMDQEVNDGQDDGDR